MGLSYIYSSFENKKQAKFKDKKIVKFFLFISVLLLIISVIFFFTVSIRTYLIRKKNKTLVENSYASLYKEKNYTELVEKMDSELKSNPVNIEYLIYRGYSYFHLAEGESDFSKSKVFYSLSLIDLRRSVALGAPGVSHKNIYYCIGKIYFYLGRTYYNQSIDYLNRAMVAGYEKIDLFYTISVVYSYLGRYKDAIGILDKALTINKNGIIYYTIGSYYYKMGNYEKSASYLKEALKIAETDKIKESSLFSLGMVYFDQGDYNTSLNYFDAVIKINENNAQAYFQRGEIYFNLKDQVKARSEWRKTLEIDPSHIMARNRI